MVVFLLKNKTKQTPKLDSNLEKTYKWPKNPEWGSFHKASLESLNCKQNIQQSGLGTISESRSMKKNGKKNGYIWTLT